MTHQTDSKSDHPPSKMPSPSFLPSPLLNLQTVQAPPFLGNPPTLYVFHDSSPLKVKFFSECPKY